MHSCGCSLRHVASQEVPDLAAPTPTKSSLILFAFTSHLPPASASVAAGGIATKLPSETNLFPEKRPTRGCRYDKNPATALEFSGPSGLESMVSNYVA